MQVVQGATGEFSITFRDVGGTPIAVDDPKFEIFNAQDVSVFGPEDAVVDAEAGTYTAEWDADESVGWFRIVWTADYLGAPVVPGQEWFEVVAPGQAVTLDDVAFLRMMAGDRMLPNQTEADRFFSNHDLQLFLNEAGGDVNAAASLAWRAKAAHYAELIDIEESGSSRKMSQKYRQASDMAESFAEASDSVLEAVRSGWRVVGRVVNLDQSSETAVEGTPFSGYTDHIRVYPLKRFPSVMSGNPY